MANARPTIVLIDDEPATRDAFGDALEETLGVEVRRPNVVLAPGRADDVALEAALRSRPDLIIIDIVWTSPSADTDTAYYDLPASKTLRRVLSRIPAYREGPVRTYLLSGYRQPSEIYAQELKRWRAEVFQAHFDVQSLLSKPIHPRDIGALLRKAKPMPKGEAVVALDASSLPMRLLGPDRVALVCNDAWRWGLNDPDPQRGSQRNFEVLGPAVRLKGPNRRLGLESFRIEEIALSNERHLQIAHPLRRTRAISKSQFLAQLFDVVREVGFTRMRYYERSKVPNEDRGGYLRQSVLVDWFPKKARALDLSVLSAAAREHGPPYRLPISALSQPLANADANMAAFDCDFGAIKLDQLVWQTAGSQSDHCGVEFFNKLTRSDPGLLRMRVPIYVTDVESGRHICEAMLVLDCKGAKEVDGVPEQSVEWLKVPLLAACFELHEILRLEAVVRERESYKAVRSRALVSLDGPDNRVEGLALGFTRHAAELAGAQGAALFWSAHPDLMPTVAAVYPPTGSWVDREPIGLNQLLDAERHPVAYAAWRHQKAVFKPCVTIGVARKPQSRMGLPIVIAGKAYGVVGFMHRTPFFFDDHRVELIRQLIEFFAFPLQFAGQHADRELWEAALIHELRSPVAGARDHLQGLARRCTQAADDDGYKLAKGFLKRMSGTILSLERLMREPQLALSSIGADEALGRVLDAIRLETAGRRTFRCDLKAGQVLVLGHSEVLDRILFILLDNAVKYGKRRAAIDVMTQAREANWALQIVSKGAMAIEDYRHCFDTRYVKVGRNGMHIGLATAQKMAITMNASLKLENDVAADCVRAYLNWPIHEPRA